MSMMGCKPPAELFTRHAYSMRTVLLLYSRSYCIEAVRHNCYCTAGSKQATHQLVQATKGWLCNSGYIYCARHLQGLQHLQHPVGDPPHVLVAHCDPCAVMEQPQQPLTLL